jgi:hypothetical protein
MDFPAPTTPIACDMTGAPDTGPERLREYQRLFSQALIGRERTASGVRFRFRAQSGTEAWVRDLAAREKACCAFFTFTITALGEEVRWDATVIDDDIARAILEEFYALPATVAGGFEGVHDRFTRQGLQFTSDPRDRDLVPAPDDLRPGQNPELCPRRRRAPPGRSQLA